MPQSSDRLAEIEKRRVRPDPARRVAAAAMEDHAYQARGHGSVCVTDISGGDDASGRAMDVSFGNGTMWAKYDDGAIRPLTRFRNLKPVEMLKAKLQIKPLVSAAKQWICHRTDGLSELCARYLSFESGTPVLKRESLGRLISVRKDAHHQRFAFREHERVNVDVST